MGSMNRRRETDVMKLYVLSGACVYDAVLCCSRLTIPKRTRACVCVCPCVNEHTQDDERLRGAAHGRVQDERLPRQVPRTEGLYVPKR